MNIVTRTVLLVSIAVSTLAGCAENGASGTRTAYDKACRNPMMKNAAAREAFWCWRSVGAESYEEWTAYERAARMEEARVVAESGVGQAQ
jgi:hypothetical protein